jgi:hypothetical protein
MAKPKKNDKSYYIVKRRWCKTEDTREWGYKTYEEANKAFEELHKSVLAWLRIGTAKWAEEIAKSFKAGKLSEKDKIRVYINNLAGKMGRTMNWSGDVFSQVHRILVHKWIDKNCKTIDNLHDSGNPRQLLRTFSVNYPSIDPKYGEPNDFYLIRCNFETDPQAPRKNFREKPMWRR